MKTSKKNPFLSLFSIITVLFVINSTLHSKGKIIIIDGTSTAGKTSICRNLRNCHCLSYDKTAANLFAEVIENKIAKLDESTVALLVKHAIVSMEEDGEGVRYKLPRNNLGLLFEKAALFKEIMSQSGVTLGYSRTEEARQRIMRQKEEGQSETPPIVLLTESEKRECIGKIEQTMFEEAVSLVRQGKNVVIDTVIEESSMMEKIRGCFSEYEIYFVLVYCSIKDLVTRVQARKRRAAQKGISDFEERKLNQPLEQFLTMYRASDSVLDDQLSSALVDSQDSIVSMEAVDSVFRLGGDLFDKGYDVERLRQDMIQNFSLVDSDSVRIIPKFLHDLIVDNGEKSSLRGCVQRIQSLVG